MLLFLTLRHVGKQMGDIDQLLARIVQQLRLQQLQLQRLQPPCVPRSPLADRLRRRLSPWLLRLGRRSQQPRHRLRQQA